MPVDRVFVTFLCMEALFLVSGILILVFSLMSQPREPRIFTLNQVAQDLLLNEIPLRAAIANAVMIFITFLLAVPGFVIPTTRGWLKIHGLMVVICAITTLVIGLDIWFDTLRTRENLSLLWNQQPSNVQSMLQQELKCCGYTNSTSPPFVQDTFCTNPQVAAAKFGCVRPFSTFANGFLDVIFTGAFGFVGFDTLLIMMVAIVLKDRKEKARYRHIDEKSGLRAF